MSDQKWLKLGRIISVYGIKGWVKVYSYTDPIENIFDYPNWHLVSMPSSQPNSTQEADKSPMSTMSMSAIGGGGSSSSNQVGDMIQVCEWRRQGKNLVAKVDGYHCRDTAGLLCGKDIVVDLDELPVLAQGEYYWHQLEGLDVWCDFEQQIDQYLGKVSHLIETGSNDVLVVKGCKGSIDRKERLIPYLPDQGIIKSIELDKGVIRVSWDPDF